MENERSWSSQQQAIFGWFKQGKGNLVVRARAGTGKTTTIIEGINWSPDEKIVLAAFNNSIAKELKDKLKNPKAEAKTLHSIGFSFVLRNWSNCHLDNDRGIKLARQAMGPEAPDMIVSLVSRLASKGKSVCPFPKTDELVDLAYEFDLDPDEQWVDDGWDVYAVANGAVNAMTLAATQRDGIIDFDDMCFLPVRNKWVRPRFDLVVIDEAQDMCFTQIALAKGVCKPTGRICVVGDDRQAIYGFRGADSGSIDRLKTELKASELGLTITYRCPKNVVALAQKLVPDYQSAPTAPEGLVTSIVFDKLHELAAPGDFVLSRKNAPLVKVCLRLLRYGTRATIEGKDVGKGLKSVIKKVGGKSVPDFLARLTKWEKKQHVRLRATGKQSAEKKCEVISDQVETLIALVEGVAGLSELNTRIDKLFDETQKGNLDRVVCSSVHKAKGKERDVVYALEDTLYPGGRKTLEEENIHYVMITRAKSKLVWVKGIS